MKNNNKNPWFWIPTLYFAEGLPYVIIMTVSVIMYKNLATFISGTQNIIRIILQESLKDLKINQMMDGAVEFETTISYDRLNFFCFNNIFSFGIFNSVAILALFTI